VLGLGRGHEVLVAAQRSRALVAAPRLLIHAGTSSASPLLPQPARSDTRAECASWILRCRSADSPLRTDWQKIWKGLVAKKGVRVDRAPAIKQTNK
jgi:hypothetical protein